MKTLNFKTLFFLFSVPLTSLFAINIPESDIMHATLRVDEMDKNPLNQVKTWLKAENDKSLAFALATATKDAKPFVSMMLAKDITNEGVIFVTNIHSFKAKNLQENPYAAASFYLPNEQRQISLQGKVQLLSKEKAKEYFYKRSRSSQIASYISLQGEKIADKDVLIAKYKEIEKKYEGKEIPVPDSWGVYLLVPSSVAFWQAGAKLLHDNILFVFDENTKQWSSSRLAP